MKSGWPKDGHCLRPRLWHFLYLFRRNATLLRFRLFRSLCLSVVCLSVCRVVYCVMWPNGSRQTYRPSVYRSRIRMLDDISIGTIFYPLCSPKSPQMGFELWGHNLTLKLRPNGDKDSTKSINRLTSCSMLARARLCIKLFENRGGLSIGESFSRHSQ